MLFRDLLLLYLSTYFLSCVPLKRTSNPVITPAEDKLMFVVMAIEQNELEKKNNISFISKTPAQGRIKGQTRIPSTANCLTIYHYSGKKLLDSLVLEHPLYKHFEYFNEQHQFAIKDTVLKREEFFFRIQLQGQQNSIKIVEKLQQTPPTMLTHLNL